MATIQCHPSHSPQRSSYSITQSSPPLLQYHNSSPPLSCRRRLVRVFFVEYTDGDDPLRILNGPQKGAGLTVVTMLQVCIYPNLVGVTLIGRGVYVRSRCDTVAHRGAATRHPVDTTLFSLI